MQQSDLIKIVAGWLNKAGIGYMLTGAWSVIYHGRIRISHDLDFVVEMKKLDVQKLVSELARSGKGFLYQDFGIREAVDKQGMFMVSYLPTSDKIDFWLLKDDDFDRSRFKRRLKVKVWGEYMYITSAEDTILQKLKWYSSGKREKDIVDAAFVWQLQKKLNKKYICKWAKKLGVVKYLTELDRINLEDHY